MEMSGITPALWTVAKAVTVEQVALYTVVGLAAVAALYVLVRHIAPEVSHLARDAYDYVMTPHPEKKPTARDSVKDLGAMGNRNHPPTSSFFSMRAMSASGALDDSESEFHLAQAAESLKTRAEQASGLPSDHSDRAALIREFCDWLEAARSEQAIFDIDKLQARISSHLKDLLASGDTKPVLDALKVEEEDGRELLRVRGDGNCAYYAIAIHLIISNIVPDGFPTDNFVELSEKLREDVSELLQDEAFLTQLEEGEAYLLDNQVHGWLNAWLKQQLNQVLSTQGESSIFAMNLVKNSWERSYGIKPESSIGQRAVRLLLSAAEKGHAKFEAGFTDEELENLVGEDIASARKLYLGQIGRPGFFASIFELSVLANKLNVPLVVENPVGNFGLEFNCEGLRDGEPRVVIRLNRSNDHFDMVMPPRAS